MTGSLSSLTSLENAAIALGDQMDGPNASMLRERLVSLGFGLSASQRLELAELVDDIAHALSQRP